MSIRNLARASLIHGSSLLGIDRLFLKMKIARGLRGLVIGMHETPASLRSQLQRQLDWASRHFAIVGLEQFARLWENKDQTQSNKPLLLFTFDDGRESNFSIAAPLLESYGARGVFFVVPEFAECPPQLALEFYRSRINPSSKQGDESWEDWKPMSVAQIAELVARGHAVGNHTSSHARLVGLSPDEVKREIVDGAEKIHHWTGKPVDAFAWTFSWDAIDRSAWEVARKHHRYCFTPCPGAVDPRIDSANLIWRREIEARYSSAEYRFQYCGLGDAAWSARRVQLRRLLLADRRDA